MEEKKGKKKIIIAVIIIVAVAIAAIGGYFAYKYVQANKSIGSNWADTYYAYLEEQSNSNYPMITKGSPKYEAKFIQLEKDTNPIMTLEYTSIVNGENKGNCLGIYTIKEDNTVWGYTTETQERTMEIVLLYNREMNEYRWYTKSVQGEYTTYEDILKNIGLNKIRLSDQNQQEAEQTEEYKELQKYSSYTFSKSDMPAQTIEDTTPISKFEEIFIVPENIPEIKTIEISDIKDLKQIKEKLIELFEEYKDASQVITEQVEQTVADKVTSIENRKIAIQAAQEQAKKEAEEKARYEALEKAKQGIQAGSYTLKYGTYKSEWGYKYTIKQDGTYTYNGLGGASSGKYKVYYYKGHKDEVETEPAGWIISFSGGSNESFYIKANNKFTALQYANTFTWRED